jgi:signal peptidase I
VTETHEQHRAAHAPRPRQHGSLWRELPVLIVIAVLVAVTIRVFVLQTFWIPSGSMEHTLDINDRVLVNKISYDFRSPHRGEVIVFRSPVSWRTDPAEKDFIKRVIALGGDHITCCDRAGRISVNGHALDETPYLYRGADGAQEPPSDGRFDVRVPTGRIWVMGDHRLESGDSREHYLQTRDPVEATIPASSVIGDAFAIYWPPSRMRFLGVPRTFDKVPDP